MKIFTVSTLLLLLYPPCVTAQEPAAPRATTSSSAPLVVKTMDEDIATQILMMMESGEDVPTLKQGDHYVLTMDSAGKMSVAAGSGKTPLLSIHARPVALMQLFREPIEDSRATADALVGMALQQSGGDPADAEAMVKALFDFPQMIDVLRLELTGNLEALRSGAGVGDGFGLEIDLQPVADTPFHRFASIMTPNSLGAPVLPKGQMSMQLSLSPEGIAALSKPAMEWSLSLSGADTAEARKLMAVWADALKAMDGTMGISMDFAKGTGSALAGLKTPADVASILNDPEYWKLAQSMLNSNPMTQGKASPNFLTHRDIKVHKVTTKADDMAAQQMPFPLFSSDGEMEILVAVAGSYQALAMFGEAASTMVSLVDLAVDNKVKRSPLRDNALMTMDMDIAAILGSIGMGDEDAPKSFGMTLARNGSGLNLKLRLK